jgi:hypothetical protein
LRGPADAKRYASTIVEWSFKVSTEKGDSQVKKNRVIKAVDELRELFSTLNTDMMECLKLPDHHPQFIRRMYTRSAFALIEGTLFQMKQTVLEASNLYGIDLSKQETALLSEESYDLNDKGEPITKAQYHQLPKNLKFAFKTMARVFDAKYDLKVNDNGWTTFLEAIKIRNRVTHPKQIQDIIISDKEMHVLGEATLWFGNSVLTLLQSARISIQNKNSQIKSQGGQQQDDA